jgi:protocadherin alpha
LCPEGCDNKRPCAECRAFQHYEKHSKESCTANCSHVTVVDEFSQKENAENWHQCQYRNADNCNAYFRYNYYAEEQVEALKTASDCPEPVNILPIIIGVIVGIILIGLALLLIWKICVTLHDRREFARFENERENALWEAGQNPIYKQATSTYQNPQFGKD